MGKKKRKRFAMAISLGTPVALLAAWFGTGLQQAVCTNNLVFGSPIDRMCDEAYRAVPLDQATEAIDIFLGRSSAAEPRQAWDMLDEQRQTNLPFADFRAQWDKVLWAERTKLTVAAEGQNRWNVSFRSYGGADNESTGVVREMTTTIGLRLHQNRDGVVVTEYTLPNTVEQQLRQYQKVSVSPGAKTYNLASSSSRPTPFRGSGGQLAALCQLVRRDGEPWLRTHVGWLSVENVLSATHTIPDCDPSNDQRAEASE